MGKRLVKTVLPRYTNSQKGDEKMVSITDHNRNAIQNHKYMPTISYPLEGPLSKEQKISSVGKDTEKLGPLHNVGRNIKWGSHYGKCFFIQHFLKTLKIALYLMQQSYFKAASLRDICTALVITAFTEVRGGRKVNFHQQMNGYKCGMHI